MIKTFVGGTCGLVLWALCGAFTSHARASQPPPPVQGAPPGAGQGRTAQDPAAVDRGKALFGVSCGFCHGSDARGGSTGPNLWRSALVLTDRDGTALATLIREGRPDKGMPPTTLPDDQIADIATFLRSLPVGGRDPARVRPPSIVVGNAADGERFFQKTCAGCHSTTGDLKGLATTHPEPRQLQHAWLMPGSQRGEGRRPRGVRACASRLRPATRSRARWHASTTSSSR